MNLHRLTVASYNIHRCVGLDGKTSVARIADVIGELDCDIVAIQEVDNTPSEDPVEHIESMQLEYLKQKTGYQAIPGLRIIRHTGEYGNTILTRLPIATVRRIDLSYGRYEPRGAIDAEIDLGPSRLRVVATHFGLFPRERRFQWLKVMSALAENASDLPTVVMGDMNEWFAHARLLREARKLFGETPVPKAFPARWPFLRLTRIWCRPRRALISIEAHRTKLSQVASDHLPVRALLELPPHS
jgi:endonuclease/exonuclease/phosphatase family metal-dependent hydrolase